jgi:hypothetical protein
MLPALELRCHVRICLGHAAAAVAAGNSPERHNAGLDLWPRVGQDFPSSTPAAKGEPVWCRRRNLPTKLLALHEEQSVARCLECVALRHGGLIAVAAAWAVSGIPMKVCTTRGVAKRPPQG